MKITKKQLTISVVSVAILLISLVIMFLDIFVPLNLWTHPALTFLLCMTTCFGVLLLVLGFKDSFAWYCFVGAILLSFAVFYVTVQYLTWWICLIVVFVLLCVAGILCFVRSGSKTEFALNNDPEYKNYKKRKAEKEITDANKGPEELPEIKSFK